jgi:hypothetical protein
VALQVFRHCAAVLEQTGQHLPISPDDRIALVEDVERHRAVIGVDDRLDGVPQIVPAVELWQRAVIAIAVGIVRRGGIGIDDIGIMVPVRDDIRITVKDQEWRQPFDPLDNIPPQQHPAFGDKISGNEEPRPVALMGDDELAPEAGKGNSTVSIINRLGIHLALRKIEFLFGGPHIDPVPRQGTVIDPTVSHGEVALGLDRNIMRPKYRISPAVHFIDQDGDSAVAVSIFEREIHPDLRLIREFLDVELTGGDQNLPLGGIDDVAIDVDTSKSLVRPQTLDLLELGLERSPIPDARVLQGWSILVQILAGERRGRDREFLLFHRRPV